MSLDILLDPARGLEGPVPKEEPSAPAASAPTAPSLRELLKRRLWLFLLPMELVVFAALALWRLGNAPSLALILLTQGLWLCFLLYLLLLVIYFLVWGIRYFKQRTRPPK